jgi:hypothetical protein
MATYAFATVLTDLNTVLGDSADVTFTSGEKTRALTRAWNDPYVVSHVWDTSLTYTQGTYQYTQPSTLTSLQDIYIAVTGASLPMPDPIDSDLWEKISGKIQFSSRTDRIIPTGYTLYLKGHYKLLTTDSLPNEAMYEYVLSLAGVNTLTLLGHKKANLFVKNDTTMGEMIGLRRELQNDVREGRQRLRRTFESA